MPKDKNNGREMTPDEKFRSFFSTTAVDIPEEMTRRDENQPEEKPQKRFGLFGRGKEKQETDEAAAEQPQEMPTGEVRLGEDAQPEPEADLELMLKPEADPEQELAPWPFLEKEAEDAQAGGKICTANGGPPGGSEAGNTPAERCPGGKTRRAAQHGKASPAPQECAGGAAAAGRAGAAGDGTAQGDDQRPERPEAGKACTESRSSPGSRN